jgi:hypothetical protein
MTHPTTAKVPHFFLMVLAGSVALMASQANAQDGAKPGDAAMTCEQIAAELAPYAQQLMPSLQALGASQQQLYEQSRAMYEKRKMEHALDPAMATAGAVDPTGAAKRAYAMAAAAQAAKEKAENDALANSPLAQQYKAQSEQFAAQGKELQSDARLQRLMQLGQEKHCDRK